jgi:hypothetical protein
MDNRRNGISKGLIEELRKEQKQLGVSKIWLGEYYTFPALTSFSHAREAFLSFLYNFCLLLCVYHSLYR